MENEIDELIAAGDNLWHTMNNPYPSSETTKAQKLLCEKFIESSPAIKALLDECNAMKEDLVTLTSTNNELANEVMYLRKRLEKTHVWVDGKRVEKDVPECADGISCRDATIDLQDKEIKRQAETIEKMREGLEDMYDKFRGEKTIDDPVFIKVAKALKASKKGQE